MNALKLGSAVACIGLSLLVSHVAPAECVSTSFPNRYILLSPNGACPTVAGWSGTPLFAANSPAPMRSYCVYQPQAATSPPPAFTSTMPFEAEAMTASTLDPMGYGKGPALSLSIDRSQHDPRLWHPLEVKADKQWGIATDVIRRGTLHRKVRVAVIDNEPANAANVNDAYPHAEAVSRIVKELACVPSSNPTCLVEVKKYLALAMIGPNRIRCTPTPSIPCGGNFGSPAQVAVAVANAVNEWLPERGSTKLVLNLSIGWQEEKKSTLETKVVGSVLTWARCLGATIIAAAGNAVRPQDHDALYPALFEKTPFTASVCSAYSVAPPTQAPTDYAPLVYAVGGVDVHDLPLATTRRGSRPRLAAYAHAVTLADEVISGNNTPFLTGTSVAAAAASGAAAALWAFSPQDLSATQVMGYLYRGAVPLGVASQLGLPSAEIRRLSLCGAFAQLPTPVPSSCQTVPVHAGQPPSLPELTTILNDAHWTQGNSGPMQPVIRATILDNPSAGPQPTSAGCPTCTLTIGDKGDIVLDASLTSDANGALMFVTLLPSATTTQITHTTDTFKALLPRPSGAIESATATFVYPLQDGTSITAEEQLLMP